MDIGSKIKELREQNGYSMEDVAKKIGVAIQTVFKYEKGLISNIPLKTIKQLSELFDVEPSFLTGWDEPPKKCKKVQIKVNKN